MVSGSSANLSSRSICWSNGSVMSVPSRSMNRIFLDTGDNLQGGVVFFRRAHGHAHAVGEAIVAAAVAQHDPGGAGRRHDPRGISCFKEEKITVARPDVADGGERSQRSRETLPLGHESFNRGAGGGETFRRKRGECG